MRKIIAIVFTLCICLCICACDEISQQIPAINDIAHSHNYGQWQISKPVTCLEDGEEKRTCECGAIETRTIDKMAHTEVIDNAVAPTCTETGLTEGKHCSVCNTLTVKQETVKAKGHTEVVDQAVAPTCTETGLTEGKHCSECNTIIVTPSTIPVKGHTEVVDTGVEPTCTTTGLTEGKHCSACNTIIVPQEVIEAQHNAPYGICLRCNEIMDEEKAVNHYFSTDISVAQGKYCATYYRGQLYVQYYIYDVYPEISMATTYDGRIAVTIKFHVIAAVIEEGEYYSSSGFLNYIIVLGDETIDSGYMSIRYNDGEVQETLYFDNIDSVSAMYGGNTFYINVGDYYF